MFALGNSLFTFGVCSARERSFEEARGETEVGRCRLQPLLAPEPRSLLPLALAPRTRPRHANRTPTWISDLRKCYFAWNCTIPVLATVVAFTATLSSNSCKSTIVFLYILLLFCRNSSPQMTCFLGKWTVTASTRVKKLAAEVRSRGLKSVRGTVGWWARWKCTKFLQYHSECNWTANTFYQNDRNKDPWI